MLSTACLQCCPAAQLAQPTNFTQLPCCRSTPLQLRPLPREQPRQASLEFPRLALRLELHLLPSCLLPPPLWRLGQRPLHLAADACCLQPELSTALRCASLCGLVS